MGGYFLEPLNDAPADRLVTPNAITPMWYMAPFYAMLRAIPDKTLGVFIVVSALGLLFWLPWLDNSSVRSMRYKGRLSNASLFALVIAFLTLLFLGRQEMTTGYLWVARVCTVVYFSYFLLMPFYTRFESYETAPRRIPRA